ncbi:Uncharacterised protein [Mycobacteroides abscessus subsp. abscessus]|nr:Uncharacterised protein [Mycobacteroides abscessus subsp. abscessus]
MPHRWFGATEPMWSRMFLLFGMHGRCAPNRAWSASAHCV